MSYITVTNLAAALGSNDIIIDAAGSAALPASLSATAGTGSAGSITVSSALSWSGSGNLTLTAGVGGIEINAAITSTNATKRNLTLTSAGRIRAASAVLTVGTLTATASNGQIYLNGANAIATLGSLSAAGDITVRNSAGLSVAASALWSGAHGVTIALTSGDLTLGGAATASGKYLRLDIAAGKFLGGANTLTANGMDVYYTSVTTGNSGTIAVGSGSFTFVNDKRTTVAAVTLGNTNIATTATNGWGAATTASGLTVSGTGSLTGVGVVYGGTVEIQGIGTGGAKDLRYIEGTGIALTTAASAFSGSLVLVSSGSGITFTELGNQYTRGIQTNVSLTVGTANDGRSDLLMVQRGDVQGNGIHVNSANVTVGRDLLIVSQGTAYNRGVLFTSNILQLSVGRDATFVNSGNVTQPHNGIYNGSRKISAGGGITFINSGMVGSSQVGVVFESNQLGTNEVSSVTGTVVKTNGQNLVISKSSLTINAPGVEAFIVTGPKLTIDLGSGKLLSLYVTNTPLAAPGNTINAAGANVFFSGALTGHNTTIAVGSGSFTWVNDKSSSGDVTLSGTTTATDATSGWQTAAVYAGTTAGTRTIAGLTVTGSSDSAITGMGVRYGGTVTISGVTAASPAGSLRYIEGIGIGVLTTASSFNGSLTLVSNGAGITTTVVGSSVTAGILVTGDLTAAVDLNLVQTGVTTGFGIYTYHPSLRTTLSAGRAMSLSQTGRAGLSGLTLGRSNLSTTTGAITLSQTGSAVEDGMRFGILTLSAGTDLSVIQSGTVGSTYTGITMLAQAANDEREPCSGQQHQSGHHKDQQPEAHLEYDRQFRGHSGQAAHRPWHRRHDQFGSDLHPESPGARCVLYRFDGEQQPQCQDRGGWRQLPDPHRPE